MKFEVSHRTTYRYSEPVVHSQHLVHLAPCSVANQRVTRHGLEIHPSPNRRVDWRDTFKNPVTFLEIERSHKELVLHARSTIETSAGIPTLPARTTPWDALDAALATGGTIDLDVVAYRCASHATTASLDIADYTRQSFPTGRPVLEACTDFMRRIYADFTFDAKATDVSTPISVVFAKRRGVCQDFAHLTLAGLRAMRVPARYVSGYILTHPPPGQPRMQGADASHAWVSVWSPEYGWQGLDPTNGIAAGEEHIVIAQGREYNDVCPISGVLLGGGEHSVDVSVDVAPLP
ncbi:MAG: transglutaminase family protein [Hyphomicrobiaceae bacterium]|nr:transglutaminase family protein [Hyphomicrobiaceae bacterium]